MSNNTILISAAAHLFFLMAVAVLVQWQGKSLHSVPIELQLSDIHVHHSSNAKPINAKSITSKPILSSPVIHSQEEATSPVSTANDSSEKNLFWDQLEGQKKDAYLLLLMNLITSKKFYPKSSILNEEEGVVTLKLSLNALGQLVQHSIEKSSGHQSLDQAAIQLVKSISVYPLPRPGMQGVVLLVPIRYEINPNH
jgi:TonB family protein